MVGFNTANTTQDSADSSAVAETAMMIDGHNARNSLDYAGTYTGMLPCADCEGIEVSLTLYTDSTYHKTSTYLGKDSPRSFEEQGKYRWDEAGRNIRLEGQEAPNQYLVGENRLVLLDMSGKKIEGDLAKIYVLTK